LAATASILLHLLVLAVFAVMGFNNNQSQPVNEDHQQVKVEYVKSLIENPPAIEKTKFQKPVKVNKPIPLESIQFSAIEAEKQISKQQPQRKKTLLATETSHSTTLRQTENSEDILNKQISFFSSKSDSRKICFLVDCSGSMQGLWPAVKAELIRSVESLLADQYFSIVFFGDNGILELTDAKLIRASSKNKEKAKRFILSRKPGGRTNALAGFEKAVKIRSSGDFGADVIFFLTDGFELMGKNARDFELAVLELVQEYSPQVRINTIGFWPGDDDRKMLKNIADLTGGEFTAINNNNFNGR
jgi:uncharacterized protein with von Willebrand factor type A (vWA) domain